MKVLLLHTHKNQVENIEPLIKQVAHVSYNKSGDTGINVSSKFIKKHVVNGGHHSLIRHAWYTMQFPEKILVEQFDYFSMPNHIRQYMLTRKVGDWVVVSGTLNMWWNFFSYFNMYKIPEDLKTISPTLFKKFESTNGFTGPNISKRDYAYTFLVEGCSRLFTHQQVRHTHNFSYNQESTRYVSYENGFEIVMPEKIIGKVDQQKIDLESVALRKISDDVDFYNYLLSNGIRKEDARGFLPNGIQSKIIVTVHRESLFGQYKKARAEGKTGKPSGEIQAVAREMIKLAE
jgi:thymidylate synthase ThyX